MMDMLSGRRRRSRGAGAAGPGSGGTPQGALLLGCGLPTAGSGGSGVWEAMRLGPASRARRRQPRSRVRRESGSCIPLFLLAFEANRGRPGAPAGG